jgi:HK97 family phage major capsid protein
MAVTATVTGAPPTPTNADELAEMLADKGRMKDVLATPDALAKFMNDYAQKTQGPGTDLDRLVDEATQRQLALYLKGAKEIDGATTPGIKASDIRRLNLSASVQPTGFLMSHRQATAHNPAAIGAVIDQDFKNAGDFFKCAWHANPNASDRARMDAAQVKIRNAFSSTSPGDGGFIVPESFRSALLAVALESSIVRPRATVVPLEVPRVNFPMIDQTTHVGSVYGGMVGYWNEEAVNLTDASAKFARVTLDAKKLTGYSAVPNELLSDSMVSFAALIERLWPEAIAFFEDLAFIGGSGDGEPKGYLGTPASAVVAAESTQASGTILAENIDKMYSRMLPASLPRAVWVVSPDTLPQLFSMARSVGTGGSAVMVTNMESAAPGSIYGRPIVVSEKAKALGSQGDISFVDFSYYLIGDRQTMTATSSQDYLFRSDQTAFKIIQRVDGRPWIQSPITPANGGSALSPIVELAARP